MPQYTIEGRAFKFGDVPYSHVMLPTQRSSDPDSGFNVTLDFRTHYPNGLLLYSMVCPPPSLPPQFIIQFNPIQSNQIELIEI